MTIVVVGGGPQLDDYRRAYAGAVFTGPKHGEEIARHLSAADAFVFPSRFDTFGLVMIEALACGTPVVATAVWGAPEVITSDVAGVLIDERSAQGVADGVKRLFANRPERSETRRFVEPYTWEATTKAHLALLDSILDSASE